MGDMAPAGAAILRGDGIIPAMPITLKSADEIEAMRVAGRLASEVLDLLAQHVRPGVTTLELDRLAHDDRHGAVGRALGERQDEAEHHRAARSRGRRRRTRAGRRTRGRSPRDRRAPRALAA